MTERSNTEGHWDEFCDWLEDSCEADDPRSSLGDPQQWTPFWNCWNAALDARDDSKSPER